MDSIVIVQLFSDVLSPNKFENNISSSCHEIPSDPTESKPIAKGEPLDEHTQVTRISIWYDCTPIISSSGTKCLPDVLRLKIYELRTFIVPWCIQTIMECFITHTECKMNIHECYR